MSLWVPKMSPGVSGAGLVQNRRHREGLADLATEVAALKLTKLGEASNLQPAPQPEPGWVLVSAGLELNPLGPASICWKVSPSKT